MDVKKNCEIQDGQIFSCNLDFYRHKENISEGLQLFPVSNMIHGLYLAYVMAT